MEGKRNMGKNKNNTDPFLAAIGEIPQHIEIIIRRVNVLPKKDPFTVK